MRISLKHKHLVHIIIQRKFYKLYKKFRTNKSQPKSLNVLGNKFTVHELSVSSHRPDEASENQASGQRHINDDLLLRWLLVIPDGNQVAPANPPNPPSNVQEQNAGSDKLTPMPLVTADNQMGKPIRATEQTLLAIVGKPPLSLLYGGVDGQGWCTVRCIELQ